MEFDFGGYATKADVLCTDGRVIRKNAFRDQNGTKVPLVWNHQRNDPENVLGHAYLENRDDGVYCYGRFNNSPRAKYAKMLVQHNDIHSLSIYANQLVQQGNEVTHGIIREVSLVMAPANAEALIDNPVVQHGDEAYEDTTRATIYCQQEIRLDDVTFDIEHSDEEPKETKKKKKTPPPPPDDDDDEEDDDADDEDETDDEPDDDQDDDTDDEPDDDNKEDKKVNKKPKEVEHADTDNERTVQDVYDEMTDEQKKVVAYMIGAALEAQEAEDKTAEHADEEGDNIEMSRNIFDQNNLEHVDDTPSLDHAQLKEIFDGAEKCGSLKQSFIEHAQSYGIENIDILFPDAKTVGDNPYMLKRNTDWVNVVLSETTHVPFSRIKSVVADITADEARAKGYVKGSLKKEEVIKLLKRVTTPTTVYKKQKLDRDDVVEITELNVIAWIKAEMRVMLDEEISRAALVSDGREADDPDKINEENIRPIWKDDDMYAHHVLLESTVTTEDVPDQILAAQEAYKGSGNPTLFTTNAIVLKMLLVKDKIGRRIYNTEAELASAMGVSKIVKVPVMEGLKREVSTGVNAELLGIIVNLRDYTFGATAGGKIGMFDDFDIDYNQYKYLLETRTCGALTVPKSAIVVERKIAAGGGSGGAGDDVG